MITKHTNLFALEQDYPFEIRDILSKCKEFEIKCKESLSPFRTLENSSDSKNLLIEIINVLMNKLRSLELAKSPNERENWYKLQRDVSNCANFLELREKELVTGTGERDMDRAKLIVLLGDYMGLYQTMVLNLLSEVKEVYARDIKYNKDIEDKKRAIFWVVYELLQVNSGLYEMRISSSSGAAKTVKVREPWQGMLVQSMRDELRQSREDKIAKVQEYAAQIKELAEDLKLKMPSKEGTPEVTTGENKKENGPVNIEPLEETENWEPPQMKGAEKEEDYDESKAAEEDWEEGSDED